MYDLVVTSKAYQDMDEALDYITNTLYNPKAATELVDEIIECQRILKENPFAYSKCIDKKLEECGSRRTVVKNYILLFKIEQKRVAILRFFHGAQDYQQTL
mgnify:CR=1 FL=1